MTPGDLDTGDRLLPAEEAAAAAEDERVKSIHSECFAAASNGEPYTDLAAEAVEVIRTVAAEHHAEEK